MLGLGSLLSAAASLRTEVQRLFSKLRGRSTYYENNDDSQASVRDTFNYGLLDKATIVLTPTATSDALVHSVKTYTGDELVDNGSFDTDLTGWSNSNNHWQWTNQGAYFPLVSTHNPLSQVLSSSADDRLKITFTLNIINGTVNVAYIKADSSTVQTQYTVSGTYTIHTVPLKANTTLTFSRYGGINSEFYLNNVSATDASSDFTFDRASSATRINSDGLIQDMQSITDPELVLNGDFSQIGSEEITNGDFSTAGALTNSSYSLGWTSPDSGLSISSGVLNITRLSNGGRAYASNGSSGNLTITSGKIYQLTYTITENTDNSTLAYHTGAAYVNTSSSVPGTYTVTYVAAGTIFLFRNNDIDTTIKIDNVSVKEVGQGWENAFGGQWVFDDEKFTLPVGVDGSYLRTVSNILTSGKLYKAVITTSGGLDSNNKVTIYATSNTGQSIESDGTHTRYFTADGTSFRFLGTANDRPISIDSVSVKDVTFSDDVDLARINYDGNGDNGHILLEPTRTNEETKSNEFSAWTPSSAANVTPNYILSPDGTQNASRVQFTGAGFLYNTAQGNNSTLFTISCYAKRNDSGTQSVGFFVNGSGAIDSAWSLTNDWKRFTYTYTSTNTSNIGIAGVSGVDISVFGFQIEKTHAYATSYMPTYGSTVTRAVETLTGSGNTTLINSTEGVLFAEIAALANDGNVRYLALSDGSTNNMVSILYYSGNNNIRMMVKSNGGSIADQNTGVTSVLDFHKIAVKYKENDFALWVDGVERKTVTSGATPLVLNTLESGIGGNARFYGKIKQTALFNEALEDDELELLTGITNFGSFGATASGGGYTII